MPVTGGTGSRMSKKNTDSEPVLSCHGVAYLDLAPLLYPGTCMMCGAFPVYAYKESDVRTKVRKRNTVSYPDTMFINTCSMSHISSIIRIQCMHSQLYVAMYVY